MICLLCSSAKNTLFYSEKGHSFFKCNTCGAISRGKKSFPNPDEEKARYQEHNNDVNDIRYQKFVSPITNAVQKDFAPLNTLGLDFGAGTGPVITKVLSEKGFKLNLYDPFFIPDISVLKVAYDFIVCCEVIEHFHNPNKEFQLLKELLKPNGKLYCMTDIFSETKNFETWYYKNDPTHVIFYSEKTLQWIQKNLGFKSVSIENRLVQFTA